MSEPLVVASAGRVAVQLLGVSAATWVTWNGVKTWRGEELRSQGGTATPIGSRRRYQTWMGAGHAGLVIGPALAAIFATDLLRVLLGEGEDWRPWWVVSATGMVVVALGVGYVALYFWTGVPDRLRPPSQRGWEIVDGDLVLARPGRTPAEREARGPVATDEGSPWT